MSNNRFKNWVGYDTMGSRQDTAVLLVGTAREHGLTVRHHVSSAQGGYFITDELASLVYDGTEDTGVEDTEGVSGNGDTEETKDTEKVEATAKTTKKTSGNRAAKTDSQKGE